MFSLPLDSTTPDPATVGAIAEQRGLRPETVRAARLYRAGPDEIARLIGLRPPCGGLVIPYEGDGYVRVRLDVPWQAPHWDRPAKYLGPPGARPRLYVPPNLPKLGAGQPLVIAEGEFKALKASEAGIPCVAIAGIWSWKARSPDGQRLDDLAGLLPEFRDLDLRRPVILCFDSDVSPEHPGFAAYVRLAAVLEELGAGPVRILSLPPGPGGEKVGLDDFFNAGHTANDFWALTREAPTFGPAFELAILPKGSPLVQIERALKAIAARYRSAGSLRREVAREAVIKELERLGVKGPARLADAALAEAAPEEGATSWGEPIILDDPEPWPEPVDGKELAHEVLQTLTQYVILPGREAAVAVVLWALATWFVDQVDVAPRLVLRSPTKRCGKTRLLGVLTGLVRRPLPSANISPAAFFRAIEAFQPTLLIDEAERFMPARDELMGLLNAGWTRPTASVVRCEGETAQIRTFKVFAFAAIAGIGAVDSTLLDRAIRVQMRRRGAGEAVDPFRFPDYIRASESLRRKLARWARDNAERVASARPEVPPGLNDRAAENWRVLLAVAEALGGDWLRLGRQAAEVLEGTTDADEEDLGTQLLADVWEIFEETGRDWLSSADLVDRLRKLSDRPWAELGRDGLTPHRLARMLARFGIRPEHREMARGYGLAQFVEPFARYLGRPLVGPRGEL